MHISGENRARVYAVAGKRFARRVAAISGRIGRIDDLLTA
jgi:hypothetical protein